MASLDEAFNTSLMSNNGSWDNRVNETSNLYSLKNTQQQYQP